MGTILDKARPILIGYPHNKILRIAFFFVHIFLWTRRGGGIYATIFAEDIRVRRVRFPYAKEKRMKKKICQNNEIISLWNEKRERIVIKELNNELSTERIGRKVVRCFFRLYIDYWHNCIPLAFILFIYLFILFFFIYFIFRTF